ncbi:MAG: metal ABC transporter permease [Candidatus Sericytochromatia bacterium]|nr:metal ABC transporter permease [Candidatus Sericytochromatia bacterium]
MTMLLQELWVLFREPMLASALLGASLGLLGVHLLARRLVFVSAALTQVATAAVALSFLAGSWSWLPGPRWLALLATAGGFGWLRRPSVKRAPREGVLALVQLLAGAAAIAIGTRLAQERHDLDALLFGTGVLISPEDLGWSLAVALLVLLPSWWFAPAALAVSADPDGARLRRLPVGLLELVFVGQVALALAVGTRVLGAMPVLALGILPALAAGMWVRGPMAALGLSALLGMLAGTGGYAAAYVLDLPVGASQTLLAGLAAASALAWRRP